MLNILYVGLGGFIGSILRYLVFLSSNHLLGSNLPYSTIIVNIIGSFFIGFLYQFFNNYIFFSESTKLLLTVGFLGGFTTFSTFSIDAFILYQNYGKFFAVSYIILSVVLSLFALLLGMFVLR
ncbi:MAG: fluoride efflux transporter CrcB [Alphaproteobacteria bacterium]|nr:fluoride efflux transporter CrcB [Alphaproteobacteria bacterium]